MFFALTLSSLGSIAVFYHDFLKDLLFNSFSEISKLSVRFLLYSVSNDLFVCHVF